ncbi:MAG: zinc ABC transporter substrate-binding protein [Desulfobacterales bacterium]
MKLIVRGLSALVFMMISVWLPQAEAKQVKTFVSIAPQQYFVQRIGGELVEVSVLVPAGADPHTYEPKPRQMAELAKTAVYFTVGIDFEKAWIKKIAATNPEMRIVNTDAGIEKMALPAHRHEGKGHTHSHDNKKSAHSHDHAGGPDPHLWLSPPLVKVQAKQIADGLIAVDSVNRTRYENNLADFVREIEALDAELKGLFAGSPGARFMVFHPSWGYFAQAYGLEQVPIEIEGKDPKPAQLTELIHHAREQGIKVVFVQPQFSARSAEMVAREIGGQVVAIDPLAANWAENLRAVGRRFKAAFP